MLSICQKSFFRIKGRIFRQRQRDRLARKARLVYGGYHLQRQAAVRAALRRQFPALQETQHRIDLAFMTGIPGRRHLLVTRLKLCLKRLIFDRKAR